MNRLAVEAILVVLLAANVGLVRLLWPTSTPPGRHLHADADEESTDA